ALFDFVQARRALGKLIDKVAADGMAHQFFFLAKGFPAATGEDVKQHADDGHCGKGQQPAVGRLGAAVLDDNEERGERYINEKEDADKSPKCHLGWSSSTGGVDYGRLMHDLHLLAFQSVGDRGGAAVAAQPTHKVYLNRDEL